MQGRFGVPLDEQVSWGLGTDRLAPVSVANTCGNGNGKEPLHVHLVFWSRVARNFGHYGKVPSQLNGMAGIFQGAIAIFPVVVIST